MLTEDDYDDLGMTPEEACYAYVKQLPTITHIDTAYGPLKLNNLMKDAVRIALEPILTCRAKDRSEKQMNHYDLEQALLRVPIEMSDGVFRYLDHGIPAGGFLTALLEGDMVTAANRASSENLTALPYWIGVLKTMPDESHGTPERVREWIRSGGQAGGN